MGLQENSRQKQAISHTGSALLVVAGPGSGKTRVIVERVEFLVNSGIPSDEILCLTFSRKASDEMKERLEQKGIMNVVVSTYHSFCRDICLENAEITGLGKDTKIIHKPSMLVWCMKNTDSFSFDTNILDISGDLESIYTAMHEGISTFKEEMISPEELESWLISTQTKIDALQEIEKSKQEIISEQEYVMNLREFNKVYKSYLKYEREKQLIDYDDMVNKAIKLLNTSKSVLNDCHIKYKYILVDEFQDNNYAQFELLKLLVKGGNVTAVGDEDQLIYTFQGASQNNFLNFEECFKPVRKIFLEENYRSTKNIVNASKLLLPSKIEKNLYSNLEQGDTVKVISTDTDESEIEYVLETIKQLVGTQFVHRKRGNTKLQYKDFAILSRRKETGDKFAQVLKSFGIPSVYVGSYNIFSNPIIRELLDYLRATNSPSTSGQTLFKIMQARGIEEINMLSIMEQANKEARHVIPGNADYVYEKMKSCDELNITQKNEIKEIIELIEMLRKELPRTNLLEFVRRVIFELTGVFQRCVKSDTLEARRDIAILNAFYDSIQEFYNLNSDGDLQNLLQHIQYLDKFDLDFEEVSNDDDSIQIMTMHKSKGKEFPIVFIPDVVQGRFPPNYRIRKYYPPRELIKGKDKERNSKEQHLQEEKRLLYVAMNRAQNGLFLITPKKYDGNSTPKKVSSFLVQIAYDKRPNLFELISYNGKGLLQETPVDYYERIKKQVQREASLAIDQMSITSAAHKLLELARMKYYEKHRIDDPQCENFDPNKVFKIDLSQVVLNQDLNGIIPPLFTENNLTLSPSSIEAYLDCPLKFKLDRMRVPGKNKSNSDLGLSIHNTIKIISKQKSSGKLPEINKAIEILDKEWIFRTFESGDQEKSNKSDAVTMIQKYLEMEKSNANELVEVEQEFALKRNNLIINGRIDRVERNKQGQYEVIDYKTSKKSKKESELSKDIQLNVYSYAVYEKYKKLPEKATLVYLREKPVTYDVNKDDVDAVMQIVDETIKKILNNEFYPTPSNNTCRNCTYNKMCEFAMG